MFDRALLSNIFTVYSNCSMSTAESIGSVAFTGLVTFDLRETFAGVAIDALLGFGL